MGVGYALASGLVKGFTQNIGMRLQEQQTARAKFDALEQQLLAAPLTDDFSNKNVDTIRQYIADGREKIEGQGVDLFGTRTDPLIDDDALSTLVGSLKSTTKPDEVDESRRFMYENKPYYTFNNEVRTPSNNFEAISNLNEIVYMVGHNETALNKWKDAPISVKEDILQVARANASAIAVDVERARSEGQDALALDVLGITSTTDALDKFLALGIPGYTGQLIGSALRKEAEIRSGAGDGSGNSGSTIVSENRITNIDAPTGDEDPAYNALYTSFNVESGNLDALNMVWGKYTNVFDMTDADSDALWDKTIQFMTENNITTQFQDSTAVALMDEQQAGTYLQSLRDITNNNMQEMTLIVGALYTPRQFKETKEPSKTRVANTGSRTVTQEDIRLYTAKVIFGSYATEKDFQEIVNQDAQLDKVLSEEVGLGALLNIADKEMQTIPLAYQVASKFAGIKNLVGFVFGGDRETTEASNVSAFAIEQATDGKTIVVSTEGNVVAGTRDDEAIKAGEVMTTGYIDSLNERISIARQRARQNYDNRPEDMRDMSIEDMEEMYARFESLRISLAFQMARAADPSGRLSDQDVKQMMALLGGDINTPRAMKAKIRRAMEEFEYQRQRFSAVVPFADASGKATRTDKLRVHGVHGLDVIAKKAGYLGSSDLEVEAAASQELTVIPPGENEKYGAGAVKVGDTIYMPGGNNTWYPDGSFIEVTDQELLKKLNAALPGV